MLSLRFNHLLVVLKIHDTGSLSETARQLNLTISAVSRSIFEEDDQQPVLAVQLLQISQLAIQAADAGKIGIQATKRQHSLNGVSLLEK